MTPKMKTTPKLKKKLDDPRIKITPQMKTTEYIKKYLEYNEVFLHISTPI